MPSARGVQQDTSGERNLFQETGGKSTVARLDHRAVRQTWKTSLTVVFLPGQLKVNLYVYSSITLVTGTPGSSIIHGAGANEHVCNPDRSDYGVKCHPVGINRFSAIKGQITVSMDHKKYERTGHPQQSMCGLRGDSLLFTDVRTVSAGMRNLTSLHLKKLTHIVHLCIRTDICIGQNYWTGYTASLPPSPRRDLERLVLYSIYLKMDDLADDKPKVDLGEWEEKFTWI